MRTRRSEGRSGALAAAVLLAVGSAWALVGCELAESVAPPIEQALEPGRLNYEVAKISGGGLERRMEEIDRSFSEPRTPKKVEYSLETCLHSISPENKYASLHKGARACAWLAENSATAGEQEKWALAGISWGKIAVERADTAAESYYYLAKSMRVLFELRGADSEKLARRMHENLLMARTLEPELDHCGPSRELGSLMVRCRKYPLLGVGTFSRGLDMLEKTVSTCTAYGENYVVLAEALIEAKDFDRADFVLEKLEVLPSPPDHSADHQGWLVRATELRLELPGL